MKHFKQMSEETFAFFKGHSGKVGEWMFVGVGGSSFFNISQKIYSNLAQLGRVFELRH